MTTMAAPPRSPEVIARKSGICKFCPERIVAGESVIAKAGSLGWVHGHCAAEWRRLQEVIDDHREDGEAA